jgi:hypothetical protein
MNLQLTKKMDFCLKLFFSPKQINSNVNFNWFKMNVTFVIGKLFIEQLLV